MRKVHLFGSVVLIAAFASLLGCGKKDHGKDAPIPSSPPTAVAPIPPLGPPDFSLTAAEFKKEFEADSKVAEAKYRGKVIEVSGSVWSVGRHSDKQHGVLLLAPEAAEVQSCACVVADRNIAAHLGNGQTVRIKGRYFQNGLAPTLTTCEIVEKGPDTLISITAEQLAKEYSADPSLFETKFKKKPLLISGVVSAVKTNKNNYTYAQLTGDGTTVIEVRDAGDDEWPTEFKVGARVRIAAQLHPRVSQPGVCGILIRSYAVALVGSLIVGRAR